MALLLRTAIPVWILCVLCALAIAAWVPPTSYLTYLAVALGFAVIVSLCIQLGVSQAAGYIVRIATTAAGAFVILAIATAILAPLA